MRRISDSPNSAGTEVLLRNPRNVVLRPAGDSLFIPDRRLSNRISLRTPVLVRSRNGNFATDLIDTSTSGARLIDPNGHEIQTGESVYLQLIGSAEFGAVVCWRDSMSFGVRFYETQPEIHDLTSSEYLGFRHYLDVLNWQRLRHSKPTTGTNAPTLRGHK